MRNEENVRKGNQTEEEFMRWLNKHNIPFWYIKQDIETYSNTLKESKIRRPDFIILLGNGKFILVDTSYNKPAMKYKSFFIEKQKIESYSNLEKILGMNVWLAFSNENYHHSVWHWISSNKVLDCKIFESKKEDKQYFAIPLDKFYILTENDNLNKLLIEDDLRSQTEKAHKLSNKLQQTGKNKTKTLSFKELRQKYPKAYIKWTKEEDIRLLNEYNKGKTTKELAALFERKSGAISSRIAKLTENS